MSKRKVLRVVLLVLLLLQLGLIFKLSDEPARQSESTSGGFIETLLRTWDKDFSARDAETQRLQVERLQKSVRTLAHLSEYTLLGLTAAGVAWTFDQRKKALLLAAAGCVLWAVSDELHQALVPGRSCQLSDIAVDSAGALLGMAALSLLLQLIFAVMKKRKEA